MRRVVLALLVAAAAGIPAPARAQDAFSLQYSLGFPTAETQDFTDAASFLGLDIGFRRFQGRNLCWTASFGFQAFDESTTETVQVTSGAVSGRQNRYVNDFPLYVGAQVHFGKTGFRPYLGANAGAHIVHRRLQMGLGQADATHVHAGFAPEAGLTFPVSQYSGVLSLRYHLTTAADDYRQSQLSVAIGVLDDF